MINRKKLLLPYCFVASFFSIVGGYFFSFLNFTITMISLFVALYLSENMNDVLWKKVKGEKSILLGLMILFLNGFVLLLTDRKDFYVLFVIQLFWYFFAFLSYFIKRKVLRREGVDFLQELFQWVVSLAALLLIERGFNFIAYYVDINVEVFHLLVAILIWKLFTVFSVYREKIG